MVARRSLIPKIQVRFLFGIDVFGGYALRFNSLSLFKDVGFLCYGDAISYCNQFDSGIFHQILN